MMNSENSIKGSDFVQSLERGLKVIEAFSAENQKLNISEAAKITNLPRPVVRRLLLTLKHLGYVDSDHNNFYLTAKTLSLGYSFLSSNIWGTINPYLEELTQKTGESSSVSVLEGTDILYVARHSTKKIMSVTLNIGSRLPAHATSMGQILLANADDETLEKYFKTAELKSYTKYTLTNKEDLLERFSEIKEKGWVISEKQLEEGLTSLAVPIFNEQNKAVAAVNISLSSYGDWTEEKIVNEFVPLLKETSSKIRSVISMTT